MDKLIEMCSVPSVSGNEQGMAELLKTYTESFCDNVYVDSMWNVISTIDNKSDYNIVLEAHTDNIGLVVKEIDENGFIKFICSGGIDSTILPTAEVVVHGKKDFFGVIGAKPPHLQTKDEDEKKKSSVEHLYIDCGLSYEKLSEFISIGDTISLLSTYSNLINDYFASGSLDNRIGCYIVSECLKRLKSKKCGFNLHGLYAVQEEVGHRGSKKGVYNIKPDVAIIVDVTFGISPYTDEEHGFEVGDGLTVAVGPNLDKKLSDKFIELCNINGISCKKEVCSDNTGTDAWAIQVSKRGGVKCILISIPLRYMHTTVEVANKIDVDNAINAICMFLEGGVI